MTGLSVRHSGDPSESGHRHPGPREATPDPAQDHCTQRSLIFPTLRDNHQTHPARQGPFTCFAERWTGVCINRGRGVVGGGGPEYK